MIPSRCPKVAQSRKITMTTTHWRQLMIPKHPEIFRMPAEWEPHRATWLAWPHRRSDWPGKFRVIPHVYGEIVRLLSKHEAVHIVVNSEVERDAAKRILRKYLPKLANVHWEVFETDRSWLRDSGPIFAIDSGGVKTALDWRFNAWAKYDDWTHDDRLPAFVANQRKSATVQPKHGEHRIVLEGGSIDVNGAGLMLTTEECLLSTVQQRNPSFERADYEAAFHKFLGVQKVLWLNQGIAGDDTHGHVDDLARFVGPRTVVIVVEENPADVNYVPLQENLERLRGFTDLDGNKLEVVPLPMPRPVIYAGQRLPASYANFYIANGLVLVPTFNDPADRVALGILAELFPNREVVGIHSVDLVWGLGTLHCMTQQEPAD
jgi:agmatine deiminase